MRHFLAVSLNHVTTSDYQTQTHAHHKARGYGWYTLVMRFSLTAAGHAMVLGSCDFSGPPYSSRCGWIPSSQLKVQINISSTQ